VTPLARTFPSWTGILTGQYPRQIGIRSNLADQQYINFTKALPTVLRNRGYRTLYATDETRFSNIDVNYGFDHVITPPMGVNDFLLGTFNDFPLSNLIVNTLIGKWLFPYSYANRPVYFSYEPDSFLDLINPYLKGKKTEPLFLAIHFCLPHHPYLWRGLSGYGLEPLARYTQSISRVDETLKNFFNLLTQAHLLDHAIVVLLSDHGEALELPGDRITEEAFFLSGKTKATFPHFYPPNLENESVNQSVGHGTDVLSLTQYHTLLAFRLYGLEEQRRGNVPGVVSLLSIQPTILELIQDKSTRKNSLASIVKGQVEVVAPHQHIFLESDFSPEAIRTVYPEVRKVVLEGIQLFQINPKTTRLTVRESMSQMIIKSKQYADIYGDWMLASYPQNDHYRMLILINLGSGRWTNDLQSRFAQKSPINEMQVALRRFYGNEIE
jgi:arylsulfatase A-like enzyme